MKNPLKTAFNELCPRFNIFSGDIVYNENKIENSAVNVKVAALSIDTGVAKRDST